MLRKRKVRHAKKRKRTACQGREKNEKHEMKRMIVEDAEVTETKWRKKQKRRNTARTNWREKGAQKLLYR